MTYRGRLAPSPTGYLHRGHAQTFAIAQERTRAAKGTLILRNDDLDRSRVREEYVDAMYEDLRWLGFEWSEGPDIGGRYAPYTQSVRLPLYREAFERLKAANLVYPCFCSRRDVIAAVGAPHEGEDEPIYPGTCRGHAIERGVLSAPMEASGRSAANWRFRVPRDEVISFVDGHFGEQRSTAGDDFGDFLVWRKDGLPSYQLACVVDDMAMHITEVVRGADLIRSTFRQLLLYRALSSPPPAFYHCSLVRDAAGHRLAKRDASTTIRGLRESGVTPEEILNPAVEA